MAPQNTQSSPQNTRDTLRERLRSLVYEVDHTGENPANRVVEVRTLTDANRSNFNHIVPKAAPFYAHTMKITHVQTNEVLFNGQDFYCVGTFAKAVANVVHHREVNWSVIFDNPKISGEYRLEYQTVGGEFVLDSQELTEVLANYLDNPRSGDWEQVIGRPLLFPPLPHHLHANDLYGMEHQVAATKEVAEAIRALLLDEEQAHPGYGQVITELFRQQRRQDKFQQDLDNLRLTNSQSSATLAQQLSDEIKRVERESKARDEALESKITNNIQTKITEIDGAYKAADKVLEGKITAAKSALEQALSEKDTSLRALIEQKDQAQTRARTTAIEGLNATISANDRAVRQAFSQADQVINRNLEAAKETLKAEIAAAEGRVKADSQQKVDTLRIATDGKFSQHDTRLGELDKKITENKKTSDNAEVQLGQRITTETNARTQAVGGLDTRLTAVEGRLNGHHEFVKVGAINQMIGGEKTFVNGVLIQNSSDPSSVSQFRANQNDTHIYNAKSGKYLQMGNDGIFRYDNKKVLLQDDKDELNRNIQTAINSLTQFVKLTTDQEVGGFKYFSDNKGIASYQKLTLVDGLGINETNAHNAGRRLVLAYEPNLDNFLRINQAGVDRLLLRQNLFDVRLDNASIRFQHKTDSGEYTYIDGEKNGGRLSLEDIYVRSDIRFKENIQPFEDPLFKLSRLNGYTYNMKGQTPRVGGIIAQELQAVCPELVYPMNEGGKLSLSYNAVVGLLVSGINELQGIVKQQDVEIRKLKEKLHV